MVKHDSSFILNGLGVNPEHTVIIIKNLIRVPSKHPPPNIKLCEYKHILVSSHLNLCPT